MTAIKKILLADDDSEDQEMLIDALQSISRSVRIDTVANGEEALRYLANCTAAELPDVLILDYKMPLMGAADVLEEIQRRQIYEHVIKMVWSTSHQREHINRCLQAGAEQYFVKPAEIAALDDIARKILAAAGAN